MARVKMRRNDRGELEVERFSPIRRLEHWFVAVVFVTLVVTGFPQKFDTSDLGHWILGVFGGLETARFIHRVAGLVFGAHALVHIGAFVIGALTGKMRMTMVPIPQDARDAKQMLRYYLGRRKDLPELPKFDYRQKFEYMGMVLGGLVMITSGLVLMYPLVVLNLLPGALIPVAKVAHSSEALLALSVLIVWHVYGVSLSPDIFPIDKTMFSGFQSVEHLKRHHAREYKELFPSGLPDEPAETSAPRTSAPPPPPAEPR